MEERLQKLLSAAGICSRRTAEGYITAGRVTVNGAPAFLGQRADWERDDIRLDGETVSRPEKKAYLLLNKPRGYVTTLSDEKGRKTVRELTADCGVRVYPVGRLDLDSEGLLLMTNDGEMAHRLLHPSHQVEKTYRVFVRGPMEGSAGRLSKIRSLEGETIQPAKVRVLREYAHGGELEITIHEGKKRQIRRMCAACGLAVTRLCRVREHTLELGELPEGQWRYLTEEEIRQLNEL